MDVLARIKRLIVRRRYRFAVKAFVELDEDRLEPEDALEAVLNAQAIKKTLRSQSPRRGRVAEKLYVIESFNYRGTLLYTKGKIAREAGEEVYYFFISAKASHYAD